MKTFEIKNNDINIISFNYNSEAVRNLLIERCKIIKGELIYRTNLGIPLGGSKNDLDMAIKEIVFDTFGVRKIKSFESKIVNRKYVLNIVVETIFNEELGVIINE